MRPDTADSEGELELGDYDDEGEVELRRARVQEYAAAIESLRTLIEACPSNDFADETTWIPKIAEAAIESSLRMEKSHFPQMDRALEEVVKVTLTGGTEPLTPIRLLPLPSMHDEPTAVLQCAA